MLYNELPSPSDDMQETENKISKGSTADFPPISGLEPIELLGSAGIGNVYKAKQSSGDRHFAVRVISAAKLGNDGVDRFLSNAKSCAGLKHPNLVNIHAINKTKSGDVFIVTDYLGNRTLASLLRDTNSQAKQDLKKTLCEMVEGVDYLHRCGIVHQRLNPKNVMIVQSGSGVLAKIVDYELAKNLGQDISKPDFLPSNAAYMSPEQCLNRDVDQRSDIYSLACIIYESFCGQAPFIGANRQELMYKQISSPVPSTALMQMFAGEQLAELLHLTLSKNPEDRMNSASRFRDSLEKALVAVPESFDRKKFEKQLKAETTSASASGGMKNSSQSDKPAAKQEHVPQSETATTTASTGTAGQGSSSQEKPSHNKASSARQKAVEADSHDSEKRSPVKAIFIVLAVAIFLLLILKDSILPFLSKPEKPAASSTEGNASSSGTSSTTQENTPPAGSAPASPSAESNPATSASPEGTAGTNTSPALAPSQAPANTSPTESSTSSSDSSTNSSSESR